MRSILGRMCLHCARWAALTMATVFREPIYSSGICHRFLRSTQLTLFNPRDPSHSDSDWFVGEGRVVSFSGCQMRGISKGFKAQIRAPIQILMLIATWTRLSLVLKFYCITLKVTTHTVINGLIKLNSTDSWHQWARAAWSDWSCISFSANLTQFDIGLSLIRLSVKTANICNCSN